MAFVMRLIVCYLLIVPSNLRSACLQMKVAHDITAPMHAEISLGYHVQVHRDVAKHLKLGDIGGCYLKFVLQC